MSDAWNASSHTWDEHNAFETDSPSPSVLYDLLNRMGLCDTARSLHEELLRREGLAEPPDVEQPPPQATGQGQYGGTTRECVNSLASHEGLKAFMKEYPNTMSALRQLAELATAPVAKTHSVTTPLGGGDDVFGRCAGDLLEQLLALWLSRPEAHSMEQSDVVALKRLFVLYCRVMWLQMTLTEEALYQDIGLAMGAPAARQHDRTNSTADTPVGACSSLDRAVAQTEASIGSEDDVVNNLIEHVSKLQRCVQSLELEIERYGLRDVSIDPSLHTSSVSAVVQHVVGALRLVMPEMEKRMDMIVQWSLQRHVRDRVESTSCAVARVVCPATASGTAHKADDITCRMKRPCKEHRCLQSDGPAHVLLDEVQAALEENLPNNSIVNQLHTQHAPPPSASQVATAISLPHRASRQMKWSLLQILLAVFRARTVLWCLQSVEEVASAVAAVSAQVPSADKSREVEAWLTHGTSQWSVLCAARLTTESTEQASLFSEAALNSTSAARGVMVDCSSKWEHTHAESDPAGVERYFCALRQVRLQELANSFQYLAATLLSGCLPVDERPDNMQPDGMGKLGESVAATSATWSPATRLSSRGRRWRCTAAFQLALLSPSQKAAASFDTDGQSIPPLCAPWRTVERYGNYHTLAGTGEVHASPAHRITPSGTRPGNAHFHYRQDMRPVNSRTAPHETDYRSLLRSIATGTWQQWVPVSRPKRPLPHQLRRALAFQRTLLDIGPSCQLPLAWQVRALESISDTCTDATHTQQTRKEGVAVARHAALETDATFRASNSTSTLTTTSMFTVNSTEAVSNTAATDDASGPPVELIVYADPGEAGALGTTVPEDHVPRSLARLSDRLGIGALRFLRTDNNADSPVLHPQPSSEGLSVVDRVLLSTEAVAHAEGGSVASDSALEEAEEEEDEEMAVEEEVDEAEPMSSQEDSDGNEEEDEVAPQSEGTSSEDHYGNPMDEVREEVQRVTVTPCGTLLALLTIRGRLIIFALRETPHAAEYMERLLLDTPLPGMPQHPHWYEAISAFAKFSPDARFLLCSVQYVATATAQGEQWAPSPPPNTGKVFIYSLHRCEARVSAVPQSTDARGVARPVPSDESGTSHLFDNASFTLRLAMPEQQMGPLSRLYGQFALFRTPVLATQWVDPRFWGRDNNRVSDDVAETMLRLARTTQRTAWRIAACARLTHFQCLSVSKDGILLRWHAATGAVLQTIVSSPLQDIIVSPLMQAFYTISDEGELSMYDAWNEVSVHGLPSARSLPVAQRGLPASFSQLRSGRGGVTPTSQRCTEPLSDESFSPSFCSGARVIHFDRTSSALATSAASGTSKNAASSLQRFLRQALGVRNCGEHVEPTRARRLGRQLVHFFTSEVTSQPPIQSFLEPTSDDDDENEDEEEGTECLPDSLQTHGSEKRRGCATNVRVQWRNSSEPRPQMEASPTQSPSVPCVSLLRERPSLKSAFVDPRPCCTSSCAHTQHHRYSAQGCVSSYPRVLYTSGVRLVFEEIGRALVHAAGIPQVLYDARYGPPGAPYKLLSMCLSGSPVWVGDRERAAQEEHHLWALLREGLKSARAPKHDDDEADESGELNILEMRKEAMAVRFYGDAAPDTTRFSSNSKGPNSMGLRRPRQVKYASREIPCQHAPLGLLQATAENGRYLSILAVVGPYRACMDRDKPLQHFPGHYMSVVFDTLFSRVLHVVPHFPTQPDPARSLNVLHRNRTNAQRLPLYALTASMVVVQPLPPDHGARRVGNAHEEGFVALAVSGLHDRVYVYDALTGVRLRVIELSTVRPNVPSSFGCLSASLSGKEEIMREPDTPSGPPAIPTQTRAVDPVLASLAKWDPDEAQEILTEVHGRASTLGRSSLYGNVADGRWIESASDTQSSSCTDTDVDDDGQSRMHEVGNGVVVSVMKLDSSHTACNMHSRSTNGIKNTRQHRGRRQRRLLDRLVLHYGPSQVLQAHMHLLSVLPVSSLQPTDLLPSALLKGNLHKSLPQSLAYRHGIYSSVTSQIAADEDTDVMLGFMRVLVPHLSLASTDGLPCRDHDGDGPSGTNTVIDKNGVPHHPLPLPFEPFSLAPLRQAEAWRVYHGLHQWAGSLGKSKVDAHDQTPSPQRVMAPRRGLLSRLLFIPPHPRATGPARRRPMNSVVNDVASLYDPVHGAYYLFAAAESGLVNMVGNVL